MPEEKVKQPCTVPRQCKSCQAQIFWGKWRQSGKSMPIDCVPNLEIGNVVVMHRRYEDRLIFDKYDEAEHHGRLRYTSHFATCPQSAAHRKAR